jgi:ribonucleoside-triphosphate reductase
MEKMVIASERERGKGVRFSKIRRITGYLTGDLSTWGDSKRSEEHDRVKHMGQSTVTLHA